MEAECACTWDIAHNDRSAWTSWTLDEQAVLKETLRDCSRNWSWLQRQLSAALPGWVVSAAIRWIAKAPEFAPSDLGCKTHLQEFAGLEHMATEIACTALKLRPL
mmetsp:Transcript_157243/g.293363  ORF Transcript_157243/g.293363 Transcript_157243/m.293363 type:complete len:105 (-) Transcript_157243:966-1280(-)